MIRIELTTRVNRPLEEVFAYVTDPEKLAEWQPNLVEITQETAGPIGVGTRLKEVRLIRRQFEADYARLKAVLESRG